MATVKPRPISKTAFLTTFLRQNPRANPMLVNAAWAKAGHAGSVSPSLVGKLHSDLGLTRDRRSTPGTSKKTAKAIHSAGAKIRGRNLGKSAFVEQVLASNPQATSTAVNQAWKKAGKTGSISHSLVSKIRSSSGLAGKPGRRRKPPAADRIQAAPRVGRGRSRQQMLAEIEARIDRLVFDLLEIGGMEKAGDALRTARRLVARAQKS
jgi:hypothetical protein